MEPAGRALPQRQRGAAKSAAAAEAAAVEAHAAAKGRAGRCRKRRCRSRRLGMRAAARRAALRPRPDPSARLLARAACCSAPRPAAAAARSTLRRLSRCFSTTAGDGSAALRQIRRGVRTVDLPPAPPAPPPSIAAQQPPPPLCEAQRVLARERPHIILEAMSYLRRTSWYCWRGSARRRRCTRRGCATSTARWRRASSSTPSPTISCPPLEARGWPRRRS